MPEIDRGAYEWRGHKRPKLVKPIMAILIVAVLSATSLSLLPDPPSNVPPAPVSAGVSYIVHVTISINGNAQFCNTDYPNNGVVSGNGTASNPYIIEGWDISAASANGIVIGNTNVYFIVRDCYVHGGGGLLSGIYLTCVNGILDNNTCSDNSYGIYLSSSSNNKLINNTCSDNNRGIGLSGSSNNILSNNTCDLNHGQGIYLSSSSNNKLINNTCSDTQGQGIILLTSSNSNTIAWNQICNNMGYGVSISSGSYNMIWNNTFIGGLTLVKAYDDGTNNRWNTSGSTYRYGNYWDDLTAPDVVAPYGIVDWSYNLTGSAGAKDYYPLTGGPVTPIPEFSDILIPIIGLMLIALAFGRARRKPQA